MANGESDSHSEMNVQGSLLCMKKGVQCSEIDPKNKNKNSRSEIDNEKEIKLTCSQNNADNKGIQSVSSESNTNKEIQDFPSTCSHIDDQRNKKTSFTQSNKEGETQHLSKNVHDSHVLIGANITEKNGEFLEGKNLSLMEETDKIVPCDEDINLHASGKCVVSDYLVGSVGCDDDNLEESEDDICCKSYKIQDDSHYIQNLKEIVSFSSYKQAEPNDDNLQFISNGLERRGCFPFDLNQFNSRCFSPTSTSQDYLLAEKCVDKENESPHHNGQNLVKTKKYIGTTDRGNILCNTISSSEDRKLGPSTEKIKPDCDGSKNIVGRVIPIHSDNNHGSQNICKEKNKLDTGMKKNKSEIFIDSDETISHKITRRMESSCRSDTTIVQRSPRQLQRFEWNTTNYHGRFYQTRVMITDNGLMVLDRFWCHYLHTNGALSNTPLHFEPDGIYHLSVSVVRKNMTVSQKNIILLLVLKQNEYLFLLIWFMEKNYNIFTILHLGRLPEGKKPLQHLDALNLANKKKTRLESLFKKVALRVTNREMDITRQCKNFFRLLKFERKLKEKISIFSDDIICGKWNFDTSHGIWNRGLNHKFWNDGRSYMVYPVVVLHRTLEEIFQVNAISETTVPETMHYEIFRLASFAEFRFEPSEGAVNDLWWTRLARDGHYCLGPELNASECFGCHKRIDLNHHSGDQNLHFPHGNCRFLEQNIAIRRNAQLADLTHRHDTVWNRVIMPVVYTCTSPLLTRQEFSPSEFSVENLAVADAEGVDMASVEIRQDTVAEMRDIRMATQQKNICKTGHFHENKEPHIRNHCHVSNLLYGLHMQFKKQPEFRRCLEESEFHVYQVLSEIPTDYNINNVLKKWVIEILKLNPAPVYNLYGTEDDFVIKPLREPLKSKVPRRCECIEDSIVLEPPDGDETYVLQSCWNRWLSGRAPCSVCKKEGLSGSDEDIEREFLSVPEILPLPLKQLYLRRLVTKPEHLPTIVQMGSHRFILGFYTVWELYQQLGHFTCHYLEKDGEWKKYDCMSDMGEMAHTVNARQCNTEESSKYLSTAFYFKDHTNIKGTKIKS